MYAYIEFFGWNHENSSKKPTKNVFFEIGNFVQFFDPNVFLCLLRFSQRIPYSLAYSSSRSAALCRVFWSMCRTVLAIRAASGPCWTGVPSGCCRSPSRSTPGKNFWKSWNFKPMLFEFRQKPQQIFRVRKISEGLKNWAESPIPRKIWLKSRNIYFKYPRNKLECRKWGLTSVKLGPEIPKVYKNCPKLNLMKIWTPYLWPNIEFSEILWDQTSNPKIVANLGAIKKWFHWENFYFFFFCLSEIRTRLQGFVG